MPKTNYICVFCGRSFENDYDACAKHEKEMHIKPAYGGIEPRYGIDKQYPDEIVVIFDNGAIMGFRAISGSLMVPVQKESPPATENSKES